MCMPATHPALYRGWRWLVEHSRFAWTVRAEGPRALARVRHPGSGQPGPDTPLLCDDTAAFRG